MFRSPIQTNPVVSFPLLEVWALLTTASTQSFTAYATTWRPLQDVLREDVHVDSDGFTVFIESRTRWRFADCLILTPGITCIWVYVAILENAVFQFGEAFFVLHGDHFSIQLTVFRCRQVALLYPNISQYGTSILCRAHF